MIFLCFATLTITDTESGGCSCQTPLEIRQQFVENVEMNKLSAKETASLNRILLHYKEKIEGSEPPPDMPKIVKMEKVGKILYKVVGGAAILGVYALVIFQFFEDAIL